MKRSFMGIFAAICVVVSTPAHAKIPFPLNLLPDYALRIIYYEQTLKVLDGSDPNYLARDSNRQNPRYKPSPNNFFPIKTYWISEDDLRTFSSGSFEGDLRNHFVRTRNGRREYRFFVHPESKGYYKEFLKRAVPAEDYIAVPLASARTLLTFRPDNPKDIFFVKVSLDREVGESVRLIRDRHVTNAIGTSDLLERVRGEGHFPDHFKFMAETFGAVPHDMEKGGMIVRPFPEELKNSNYAPLFALYGQKDASTPPLLAEMIARSKENPIDYIRNRLIRPFVSHWFDLATRFGLTMEPHGQNVLVRIENDGLINGNFLHRDLNGFNLDFDHLKKIGLSEEIKRMPYISNRESEHFQYKIQSQIPSSLEYFEKTVLFDLDERISSWMRKGWIPKTPWGINPLKGLFHLEIEAEFIHRTGDTARYKDQLKYLEKPINTFRDKCGPSVKRLIKK